jgi:hypothetical protein
MTTSDQLKDAIRKSGKTPNLIAKETGIAEPILSRFLSADPDQHQDIRLESITDKLCAYFGLELHSADKPMRKDKVKAPAVPAVDWATADPKAKRKDEGRERRK